MPIGAVAFIHRFGSSLHGQVHFDVCVVDGVFAEVAGPAAEFRGQRDAGLPAQRLLGGRGCLHSRAAFAMERLRKEGAARVYRCSKQHSEPASDKRGARVDELRLTPLDLIERIAADLGADEPASPREGALELLPPEWRHLRARPKSCAAKPPHPGRAAKRPPRAAAQRCGGRLIEKKDQIKG